MSGETGVVARRRQIWLRLRWVVLAVVILILLPVAWIGIRAFIAYDALMNAEADVSSIKSSVTSGDISALPYIYQDMHADTASAESMTSDPIWDAAGRLPGIGANFAAIHEVTVTINSLVVKGVGPLSKVAGGNGLGSFLPHNGTINLAKVDALVKAVDAAGNGVSRAAATADGIDTTHTLRPVTSAIGQLRALLDQAATEVGGVKSGISLIPPALGSEGTRNYLVALGNNDQDRANGGALDAIAQLRLQNGVITLVRSVPASALGTAWTGAELADEKAVLTPATDKLATALDAQLQPDNSVSSRALAARWTSVFGGRVDGVLSIDSVGLSFLADASGNVHAGGKTVSAVTLASYLQGQLPSQPATSRAPDAVVLRAVLKNVMRGTGGAAPYISAGGHLFNQKRLLIWSALPAEQKLLGPSPLGGILSRSNAKVTTYGVFFNSPSPDGATDLTATASVTPTTCVGQSPTSSKLGITLVSTAKKAVSEDIAVYGPVGFDNSTYRVAAGKAVLEATLVSGGRPVELFRVTVPAMGTTTLTVSHSTSGAPASSTLEIRTTPRWVATNLTLSLCS